MHLFVRRSTSFVVCFLTDIGFFQGFSFPISPVTLFHLFFKKKNIDYFGFIKFLLCFVISTSALFHKDSMVETNVILFYYYNFCVRQSETVCTWIIMPLNSYVRKCYSSQSFISRPSLKQYVEKQVIKSFQ